MEKRGPSGSGPGSDDPIARRGRVVVADDDVLFREGLASLLERSGFEVVGQAGDGTRLLELIREHVPDLAVVDIRMPPSGRVEGLQVARAIREQVPTVGILVLSAYVEVNHAIKLLYSGDRIGYLLKSRVADVAELVDALERVGRGGSVIDPSLVQELFAAHHREEALRRLSGREYEVLTLMAEGCSNTGIAQKIGVTGATVEKHIHGILTKLSLPEAETDHRRVLAVLAFLGSR